MSNWFSRFRSLTSHSDLAMALAVVLILAIMIMPVGPFLMDVFIAIIFASSILMLLISIYSIRPLDFSTFPSVLLIITLFRLSVNVASTRNILLNGATSGSHAAGAIIHSFGEFVLAGNYAVGLILFIILVVINFIVITKGASRVAEVAARFTLDAMPGKQMAIDADLNAGLINDKEAKRRREEIAQEADFYGSMDGSSKFVRGDAIAGIIITVINIIGGIIVGVLQGGMSITDAAKTFTLLTVGDGLVAQIPGIIISTAAGILITRNTDSVSLGKQISKQVNVQPKILYLMGMIMGLIGLIPQFPTLIFFTLAGGLIFWGMKLDQQQEWKKGQVAIADEHQKQKVENLEDLLSLEAIELEVGYGLINTVDQKHSGELLERITQIRKQFVLDWGVIIPSVRIKDNLDLKPGGYRLKLKGVAMAQGELVPDHLMAMDPGTVIDKIDGIAAKEPVFGLPALWITEDLREEAMYNGYTVVDIATIMATHLTESLKANLHELLGRQELTRLLDHLKTDYPKIVGDLIPEILSLGVVLRVIKNLLKEAIPIRDLKTILETLADAALNSKDAEYLTEQVRQSLFRTISERLKSDRGDIPIFTLDKPLEEFLIKNVQQTDQGLGLMIDAKTTQNIINGLSEKMDQASSTGEKMVVLCSPYIRRHLKKLIDKFLPSVLIIGHNEIVPEASIRSLGTIRI